MSFLISICAITVIRTWIQVHPLAYFYLSTGSPSHLKARGHQTSQTQRSLGTKQYNSLPTALSPPPEPPTQLGNKGSQPFVKPLMLPQSQLQNTPSGYLEHTWQLPTLLTPLSRSTSLPSGTCMCQQDYTHNLTANSLHTYNSSEKVFKETRLYPTPQELVYQLPYKLCNPSTTCSSTNPNHMPTPWYGQPAVWPSLASSGSVNSPSPSIPATTRNVTFPQQIFQ